MTFNFTWGTRRGGTAQGVKQGRERDRAGSPDLRGQISSVLQVVRLSPGVHPAQSLSCFAPCAVMEIQPHLGQQERDELRRERDELKAHVTKMETAHRRQVHATFTSARHPRHPTPSPSC